MSEPPFTSPLEQTVVIVGVGLIGGSLAAAIKIRNVAQTVIGVGRDAARIEAARACGLIDEAATDVTAVVGRADLVFFCTPVDRIAKDVRLAELALTGSTQKSTGNPNTLFTDVGSVKEAICTDLVDVPRFIGSHPIAGSHHQGFEAADPQLFEGRMCVLTPLKHLPEQVDRLERFWSAVGMRTVRMSPSAHDHSLAMTSHLPHVVAAALASTLTTENRSLTGTGFRDTTRVAAGDPDLWTGILLNNANSILNGLDDLERQLSAFRNALSAQDADAIKKLLKAGQLSRTALDESRRGFD